MKGMSRERACLLLLSAFAAVITPSDSQEGFCTVDEDCPNGLFCAKTECDSFEGWMHGCSICVPCSSCRCDKDSIVGSCPSERCPGTPLAAIRKLEGVFFSATRVSMEWGGDVCLTVMTFKGGTFKHTSYRVPRAEYDAGVDNLWSTMSVTHATGTVCQFPDYPGTHIGQATLDLSARADLAGRLTMNYEDGRMAGSKRMIDLRHNCPLGLTADWHAASFVPVPSSEYMGVKAGYDYSFLGSRGPGYYAIDNNPPVRMELEGPAEWQPPFERGFHGSLLFGSNRKGLADPGGLPSLVCNVSFHFDPSIMGVFSVMQQTWGCQLFTPEGSTRSVSGSNSLDLLAEGSKKGGGSSSRKLLDQFQCTSGQYYVQEVCQDCPMGFYQPQSGQTDCLACPGGWTTVNETLKTEISECCASAGATVPDKEAILSIAPDRLQGLMGTNLKEYHVWQADFLSNGPCADAAVILDSNAVLFEIVEVTNCSICDNPLHLSQSGTAVRLFKASDLPTLTTFRNISDPAQPGTNNPVGVAVPSFSLTNVVGHNPAAKLRLSAAGALEAQLEQYSEQLINKESASACEFADTGCNTYSDERKTALSNFATSHLVESPEVKTLLTSRSKGYSLQFRSFQRDEVCQPGFASSDGISNCQSCMPGTFAPGFGHTRCSLCPKGSYSSFEASTSCTPCPHGTSTNITVLSTLLPPAVLAGIETPGTNISHCIPYCSPGTFSATGLEPCSPCPRATTQDKYGATYCDPCPSGWTTPGSHGTGFNGQDNEKCFDVTDFQFTFETVNLISTKFRMTVTWKIPADEANVLDMIAIFYGDPFQSKRQLQWSFTSAAGNCVELIDADACKTPGAAPVNWGSRTFEIFSAGPGNYSFVMFSENRRQRIFGAVWPCVDNQVFEISNPNAMVVCPPDQGDSIPDAGISVCLAGTFSPDGIPPCTNCEAGKFSPEIAATSCDLCQQGFYTNSGASQCRFCGEGNSTERTGSSQAECRKCEELIPLFPVGEYPPFCEPVIITTIAPNTTAPETTVPALCGNGGLDQQWCVLENPVQGCESCDDGNTNSGDGCSSACQVESGWKCERDPAEDPDQCFFTCGNGAFESQSETCDDGNLQAGDGCNPSCRVEPGWTCDNVANERSDCALASTCGNGVREWDRRPAEACDDGNTQDGDGCSSVCALEPFFRCSNQTQPDVCCVTLALCGNGVVEACEQCDDGNGESFDGCSSMCQTEALFFCQDGCSGPECEGSCPEPGPVKSNPHLGIWDWLNIDGLIGPNGELLPDAGGSLGFGFGLRDNLMFRIRERDVDVGVLGLYNSVQDEQTQPTYRGLYSISSTPSSGLSCPTCSEEGGFRSMYWPSGSLSEPGGPLPNDVTCNFELTAGSGWTTDGTKGMIISIDSLGLRSAGEYLRIREMAGSSDRIFNENSTIPQQVHVVAPALVTFHFKSFLSDGRGWERGSRDQTLRVHLTYTSYFMGSASVKCSNNCDFSQNRAQCMIDNACLATDTVQIMEGDLATQRSGGTRGNPSSKSSPRHGGGRTLLQGGDEVQYALPANEKLTLALAGSPGSSSPMPCDFLQSTEDVLVPMVGTGSLLALQGTWQGTTWVTSSCEDRTDINLDPNCIPKTEFLSQDNTCQVTFVVHGHYVREHLANCGGAHEFQGVSEGIIVEDNDGQLEQVTNFNTGTALITYHRIAIAWTRSTWGRPLGVYTAVTSFGLLRQFQEGGKFQILFGQRDATAYPIPEVNTNGLQELLNSMGYLRRLDLVRRPSTMDLVPAPTQTNLAPVLDDLEEYKKCNVTFEALRDLAMTSSNCEVLSDAFFFRDITSAWDSAIAVPELCSNPCFASFKDTLSRAVAVCGTVWRKPMLTTQFDELVYKKLVIASTAQFWTEVVCFVNRKGENCVRTMDNYQSLVQNCPYRVPGFPLYPQLDFSSQSCSTDCVSGLIDFHRQDGCCSATISEAALRWSQLTTRKTGGVSIDIGETINPWTPLGTGPSFVHSSTGGCDISLVNMYPHCAVVGVCGSINFPDACCDITCQNGGTKQFPGICYCTCPTTHVGATCEGTSPHARVTLIFNDQEFFDKDNEIFLLQAAAALMEISVSQLELDLVEFVEITRRATTSVQITIRILHPNEREVQRLAQILQQSIESGQLTQEVGTQSGAEWQPQVGSAGVPESFDTSGTQLCDDVLILCEQGGSIGGSGSDVGGSGGGSGSTSPEGVNGETVGVIAAAGVGGLGLAGALYGCWLRYTWNRVPDRQRKRKEKGVRKRMGFLVQYPSLADWRNAKQKPHLHRDALEGNAIVFSSAPAVNSNTDMADNRPPNYLEEHEQFSGFGKKRGLFKKLKSFRSPRLAPASEPSPRKEDPNRFKDREWSVVSIESSTGSSDNQDAQKETAQIRSEVVLDTSGGVHGQKELKEVEGVVLRPLPVAEETDKATAKLFVAGASAPLFPRPRHVAGLPKPQTAEQAGAQASLALAQAEYHHAKIERTVKLLRSLDRTKSSAARAETLAAQAATSSTVTPLPRMLSSRGPTIPSKLPEAEAAESRTIGFSSFLPPSGLPRAPSQYAASSVGRAPSQFGTESVAESQGFYSENRTSAPPEDDEDPTDQYLLGAPEARI